MKIEYILAVTFICFSFGCETSSAVKLAQQQYKYSYRISLANVEFFDGTIFLGGGTEGNSYRYKFEDTTYQKFVYVHVSEPYQTYLLESGDYEINELSLTFRPKIKMFCRLDGLIEHMNCNYSDDYLNGHYVNSDTLSDQMIKELDFLPRTTEISFSDKKMVFKGPGMAAYYRFQQILR